MTSTLLPVGKILRRKNNTGKDYEHIRIKEASPLVYPPYVAELGEIIDGVFEPVREIKIGATWEINYEVID